MKVADKDYYRDEDGNVTSDESKAATLLVREGQEMTAEVEELIGGADKAEDKKVAQESEEDAEADEAAKKSSKPAANKKASPSKNKGAK